MFKGSALTPLESRGASPEAWEGPAELFCSAWGSPGQLFSYLQAFPQVPSVFLGQTGWKHLQPAFEDWESRWSPRSVPRPEVQHAGFTQWCQSYKTRHQNHHPASLSHFLRFSESRWITHAPAPTVSLHKWDSVNSSTHAELQTHPALTLDVSPELALLKHQTRFAESTAFPPNPVYLVSGDGPTEHSPAVEGNSKSNSLGPSCLPFHTINFWVSLILLLHSCQTSCKYFSVVVQVFLSDKFQKIEL